MNSLTTKLSLSLALMGTLAVAASAADLSGSDWNFAYQGHYAIAGADVSGLNLGIGSIAGVALSTQLALLSGTIASAGPVSLSQNSTTALSTSKLTFDAQGGTLLLPAVKTLLYNALDANDGVYAGSLSGSALALSKGSVLGASVDGLGIVDTRVAGVGVVIDLRAVLPTNSLVGTVDGIDAGTNLAYGPRANHVTGTAGTMNTLALQARATTYLLGFGGVTSTSTGFVDVGAVRTTADSWSLSRVAVQPTPEPASLAALGVGAMALIRRKRHA